MTNTLLSWIVWFPMCGAALVLLTPATNVRQLRAIATVATAGVLLMALQLLRLFQPGLAGLQLEQHAAWIPPISASYHIGVDGISLPLVLLTALLGFLACLASYGIKERQKEYFFLYLLLQTGLLGTFVALDLFLFYVFWEVVLLPMYFLIGIWGGGRREYSAFKFFIFTLAGSLVMLLAILALYFASTPHTFDIVELAARSSRLSLGLQRWLFLAFFLGFAVKVPVVPFHTWLPDAHVDAPTPISVLLAGVLLKMGGYGFFRISYPLLPDGARWFGLTLAVLGVINIVYGAFVAMAQTDFKKMVAYSSVSHMGFVLLGLSSFNATGMQGALFQMISHGLISGGLFLLVGVLYDRTHTRDLMQFGGLGARLPVYAGFLAFFAFAGLGLPLLSGFVAEFMAFLGGFVTHQSLTMIAVLGVVLTAAYMLLMVQRVLLGPLAERWRALSDMTTRELVTLTPLLILILWLGVQPLLLLRVQETAVQQLLLFVRGPLS